MIEETHLTDHHLSVDVKHAVYKVVVLVTLLHDSEYCTVKASQLHCLEVFHHHYVRAEQLINLINNRDY